MTKEIKFRSKFLKFLNDENRELILHAFEKFLSLRPEVALTILWQLTYEMSHAETFLEFELHIDESTISNEFISTLRNELRYQYQAEHNDNFSVEIPEECQEVFDTLTKSTDIIVGTFLVLHIQNRLYVTSEEGIDRILFLLDTQNEKMFFGGIRSLGFNIDEAVYLKPFHSEIHDLVVELFDVHQKKQNEVFSNYPFAGLSSLCEDAGITLAESQADSDTKKIPKEDVIVDNSNKELPAEKANDTDLKFKPLTAKNILENQETFQKFIKGDMASLLEISQLNYDLNQVVQLKESIENLLKAAEAFDN